MTTKRYPNGDEVTIELAPEAFCKPDAHGDIIDPKAWHEAMGKFAVEVAVTAYYNNPELLARVNEITEENDARVREYANAFNRLLDRAAISLFASGYDNMVSVNNVDTGEVCLDVAGKTACVVRAMLREDWTIDLELAWCPGFEHIGTKYTDEEIKKARQAWLVAAERVKTESE